MTTYSPSFLESFAANDDFGPRLVQLQGELMGHALRLTKDWEQARDLQQDTIERALRFAHLFENGTNLRAWVHQILHNLFVSGCRRRARERRVLDNLSHDTTTWLSSSNTQIDHHEPLSARTRQAIEQLDQPYRDTLVLVDVQGCSYKDAAIRMSVPIGTVMSRLHRARRLVATRLKKTHACAA